MSATVLTKVGMGQQIAEKRKEEGDVPVCYQHSVPKPASLMVWGCISAYSMGSLHVFEGTMNTERYRKVLEQHMLPCRCLFQGCVALLEKSLGAELACL